MTAKELNRDIKRLYSHYLAVKNDPDIIFYSWVESKGKPEFKRLYFANKTFDCMNISSIKIMLRLNLKWQCIPFHQFGLFIEL